MRLLNSWKLTCRASSPHQPYRYSSESPVSPAAPSHPSSGTSSACPSKITCAGSPFLPLEPLPLPLLAKPCGCSLLPAPCLAPLAPSLAPLAPSEALPRKLAHAPPSEGPLGFSGAPPFFGPGPAPPAQKPRRAPACRSRAPRAAVLGRMCCAPRARAFVHRRGAAGATTPAATPRATSAGADDSPAASARPNAPAAALTALLSAIPTGRNRAEHAPRGAVAQQGHKRAPGARHVNTTRASSPSPRRQPPAHSCALTPPGGPQRPKEARCG